MAKIQVRRDTSAAWLSANPVLSSGEIGFETDTGKVKIGTGASTWVNLAYISGSGGGGTQGPPGAVPVRFSAPTAVLGVSATDRAYSPRTFTGARMRVASAPVGSPLTVEVQHWDGFVWDTIATLSILSGSILEATAAFTQVQTVGNMVRINCTSAGSAGAATGVAVDVLTA